MEKTFKTAIVAFFVLSLVACGNSANKAQYHHQKETIFEKAEATTETVTWDVIAEDWLTANNKMICKTADNDALYRVLSLDSLKEMQAFGRKGHGHLEWVAPHLLVKDDSTFVVVDNGTKEIYNISDAIISSERKSTIKDAINDIKTIDYPLVGYVSIAPNQQELRILDISNDSVMSVLSFIDEDAAGQSALYDFVWNALGDKLVLAHLHSDSFVICTIDSVGKILRSDYYETDGVFAEDSHYYFDVECGEYIYLLSQRNVDVMNMSGNSEIEVYNYDGHGVQTITLDFIADKMLLDAQGNRLLLTSVSDEQLHIVKL